MPVAGLMLLSAAMLNVRPLPVFAEVSIEGRGPYRFLVDTGSQTSVIDAKLAAQLGLRATYRVELVTQNSARPLPAAKVGTLRVGQTLLAETELVFGEIGVGVRGVLGLNALAGMNFTLLPRKARLDFEAARPDGEVVPLRRVEDRIAVDARMGREKLTLILDSGATNVVLFRVPEAMSRTAPVDATFGTLEGMRKVLPTTWTAEMAVGGLRVASVPAAVVSRPGTEVDGLLPASVFKMVYIDQARGEVVLVR